nr:hypothetical protein BaRGS_001813 [Batillaria attramentaria]
MLLVATWMNSTQNLNATLTFIKPGCDQVSSANQGSYTLMASPNLTGPCIWTISPPPLAGNATIRLEFTQLALQPNQTLDVYSGVQAAGSLVAHFQANTSGQGVTLPRFAIPASAWAQLVFKVNGKNNSNVTQTLIKALYQVQAACGGSLTAKQGHVTSPGFPNQYPLYSLCPWTIPKSAPGRVLFFDFPAFQTAPGHVLKIEESKANETTVVGVYEGSQQPDDLIFASDDSVVVTFSAQNSSSSQLAVGQGFSMDFWALDCGGNMSQSTASFVTPGFPTPPNNTQLCVWIVQLAPDTASPVNILNLTFSLTITGKAKAEDVISVVDGNSLRSPKLNVSWSGDKPVRALSRYNTVIIIYNNTAAAADASTGVALNVSYSTYSCKKDQLCDNGVCMHPDWKCNGHNDCGDGSDERNCSITPAPSKDSGGVKSYWVAICLLIGLLLGVAFTILAPRIIRRFRSQPYTPFRDEPVVT